VLYLAEVQKPKSGFNISGRSKTELKLLACQRTEQNWSAIPSEEVIPAPDDGNNYSPGVLVLVDMNANRQIQSQLRDAGKHLVGILHNLSRQIEKYKKEADEIESWRQSLSLQSQQLQLRQEEIYGREEDLEQTRSELDRLTQEAQALESTIENHKRQKQELATQWEQLREKEQHLDLQQQSMSGSVSEHQVDEIRTAIHQLGGAGNSGLNPQKLEATATAIEFQEELLHQHGERLGQQRQRMAESQIELDAQRVEIDRRKQQLQELQTSLEQAQTEWEVQQQALSMQQEYALRLGTRIDLEQENYQKIYLMSKGGTLDAGDLPKIDLQQLMAMPIHELQTVVENLQKEVDRYVYIVNLEEEELTEKQQAIDEINQQILIANDFDKLKLEAELHDEQDSFNMLDHTLDGQRQTMRERQTFLQVHGRVLRQRQGHPPEEADKSQIEWDSILTLLDRGRQQQQSELSQVETEIQHLRNTLEQAKAKVEQQVNAYLVESEELQKLDRGYQVTKQVTIELGAKIDLYQEMIQPLQNHIDTFKRQLADLADAAGDRSDDRDALQHVESLLHSLVHGSSIEVG
jgi:chromosome segregation ATPase